jgi:quinol monooxygenase YgiN
LLVLADGGMMAAMRNHPNAVSLHPYFCVNPGELEAVKALLPRFVEVTRKEPKCIFYGFTLADDDELLFCQEAYEDGEGLLAHLANVGTLLAELLTHSTLIRLEAHGPAAELAKLRGPMASLNPKYFVVQHGLV